MKKIILSVILTLVVLAIGGVLFIYSGKYDVSQMSHHNKITQWVVGKTMMHSINKRIKDVPPVPPMDDTTMIAEGFRQYHKLCVVCHGGAGIEPLEIVKGLYPQPPKLYKVEVTPEFGYWIVRNGIRMTSMPAFAPIQTDEQIWAITAFMVKKMNELTPEDYQNWLKKYSIQE